MTIKINPREFVNVEDQAFRELEAVFSEEYINLIQAISDRSCDADFLHEYYSRLYNAINETEEKIFSYVVSQNMRLTPSQGKNKILRGSHK